ncbi:MAG: alpha/beta fold hydrolase [Rudaea sp.]
MKLPVMCAALLGVATLIGTNKTLAQSMTNPSCEARSTQLLSALQKHDYSEAELNFDARMRAALPPDKLQAVWEQTLPAQFGAFKRAAEPQPGSDNEPVVTPVQFANGWLDMRVACNTDGTLKGLFFAPGSAPARASADQSSAPAQTETHFLNKALDVASPLGPLPGTLTLPKGDGPFPAVLLVAGSGPNDRDETIGPNKPFLDLANGLAAHGIATFRYDKRTRVYPGKMAGKAITVDDEVTNDAVTAAALLAQQPQIDATHVFVLGHSLGALMAPRIAQHDPKLTGAILMAAPVTLDLDTVLRQTRYIEHLHGATTQQLAQATAPIIAARDALTHADPAHPPVGDFFHAPASYWLSLRDYHPIVVAKNLPQPLLILQGERDYQVTPKHDFAQWQHAFAHDPRVTLEQFPGLSHLFMPAGNPPSPADYAKPGHVDSKVIDAIAQWITTQAHAKVN